MHLYRFDGWPWAAKPYAHKLSLRGSLSILPDERMKPLKIIFTEIAPNMMSAGYDLVASSVDDHAASLDFGGPAQQTQFRLLMMQYVLGGALLGSWWWFIPPDAITAIVKPLTV
jgi:hypothetical protein